MSTLAQVSRGDVVRELHGFIDVWSSRIETWKTNNQGHTESTAAQQFWGHLLRCFGVIPERIDLFERDAVRATTGNTGYIDLFWSSVVLGEAKSLGKDLVKAESQALDYLAGGSIASHELVDLVRDLRVTHILDSRDTIDSAEGTVSSSKE